MSRSKLLLRSKIVVGALAIHTPEPVVHRVNDTIHRAVKTNDATRPLKGNVSDKKKHF